MTNHPDRGIWWYQRKGEVCAHLHRFDYTVSWGMPSRPYPHPICFPDDDSPYPTWDFRDAAHYETPTWQMDPPKMWCTKCIDTLTELVVKYIMERRELPSMEDI